jgi:hypothetical protein
MGSMVKVSFSTTPMPAEVADVERVSQSSGIDTFLFPEPRIPCGFFVVSIYP